MLVVLVSDRETERRPGSKALAAAAKPLKELGVNILAVGAKPKASPRQLDEIASRKENVFYMPAQRLPQRAHQVINKQYDVIRQEQKPTSM